MDKVKKALDPITCIVVLAAVLLYVLLFYTRSLQEARVTRATEPNPVVTAFLTDYLASDTDYQREAVVEQYFLVSSDSIDRDGFSETFYKVNAVFQPATEKPESFRVCASQRNYLEIMPLDSKGADLPCRVAIFYRITDNGKISSYNIARLQPVSKRDPEWRRNWL